MEIKIKKDLKYYLDKANKIHNKEYDYSLIEEYKGVMAKYPINCPKHGVWEVSLDNHINKKSKCPKCKGRNLSYIEKIQKANKIHNNKYDYSLINEDFNNHDIIKIICKDHGVFEMDWSNHIHGKQNCPKCAEFGRNKVNISELKKRVLKLKTNYEYDWSSYKGYYDNTFRIKCEKHGWFNQQISNHLMGQRCPKCKQSRGEEIIHDFLIKNKITFETQKKFKECINPLTNRKLKYDFYIPEYNLCIEYDGELHYKPVTFFGGVENFEKMKRLDMIKNEFCEKNNINLLRISYINFNNLELILSNYLIKK